MDEGQSGAWAKGESKRTESRSQQSERHPEPVTGPGYRCPPDSLQCTLPHMQEGKRKHRRKESHPCNKVHLGFKGFQGQRQSQANPPAHGSLPNRPIALSLEHSSFESLKCSSSISADKSSSLCLGCSSTAFSWLLILECFWTMETLMSLPDE